MQNYNLVDRELYIKYLIMCVLCDQDLYQRCEKMRPTLFRLASDTEDNDEALGEHYFYTSAIRYQYLLQVFSCLRGLQQDTELSLPCSFKVMTDKNTRDTPTVYVQKI